MKKLLKFIGFALLGIIMLVGIGATYIQIKGVPKYDYSPTPEMLNLQVPRGDSAMIARGSKIATVMCKACHRGSDGKLSGELMPDLPPEFGKVAALNITRDSIHGVGAWTDGELYYFLRTGIRKDGSWAPPMMPKFNTMAEEDMKALIAWLRSDDPDLEPSTKEYPANQWNFLIKFLGNIAFTPPPLPAKPISLPDTSNKVALGRYLANDVFGCFHCHSGDFAKLDIVTHENSFRYYGGGNPTPNKDGEVVPTANLTPHPEYGIGKWTEQEFINAVKYAKKPNGSLLAYPMAPYATLTDQEAAAIFAFIKTVPSIDYKVERYQSK
jgi:mono/diheme cytochrome c family protein